MSEQTTPLHDDLRALLTQARPDTYALAYAQPDTDPFVLGEAQAPVVGETGAARTGPGSPHLVLEELCSGQEETLRRWLQLDDGQRQLAIIGTDLGELREYTPGELTASLMHEGTSNEAPITDWLSGWLYRRNAEAQQGTELGWIAAAAAWTCHMRAFTPCPPPTVLAQSLTRAGGMDEATEELVTDTGLKTADLLDRLERVYRPRSDLVADWRTVASLSQDVPALKAGADWLLDQIALRDAHAQQLRAVLEPDITDHLNDLRRAGQRGAPAPTLDAQRTAHLAQARETVRVYTAAAHSGREQDAQHLLDTFPIPARTLHTSGPARTWQHRSATARESAEDLAARRQASVAEDRADYFADPERLHAETSYLAAREGQLHLVHDALGRLAHPTAPPNDLPQALADVAAAQTRRRLIEAFGTPERALQTLDGRISYLQQQPIPAHRRTTAGPEAELLVQVRDQLQDLTEPEPQLNADRIRARLEQAMARPTPADPTRPTAAAHDLAHAHGLSASPSAGGVQR
ncbi:hypothetical protein [Streptomyces sp. NPDC055287]